MATQTPETTQKALLLITHGPSREDLRDSVGSKARQRIHVVFVVEEIPREVGGDSLFVALGPTRETKKVRLGAVINALGWADDSGVFFNLKGSFQIIEKGKPLDPEKFECTFEATYDTNKRAGTIFIEPVYKGHVAILPNRPKRPCAGFHKITFADGEVEEIFIHGVISGETTAVLFMNRNKPRESCRVLQFYEDHDMWGVVIMRDPEFFSPVKVSWE